jgi:hypothetical protein
MITPTEAVNLLKRKEPKLTITGMADYNSAYYLISAQENAKEPDYSGNYFAVNKRSGAISYYTPGADFDNFFDAINNRRIKISTR